jgi:DedD protein
MDKALKQRLVGASVLIILAVIVLPMLLSGRSDTLKQESRQIELPPKPEELSIETRRFPVGIPNPPAPSTGQEAALQNGGETQGQVQTTEIDTASANNKTPGSSVQHDLDTENDPGTAAESDNANAIESSGSSGKVKNVNIPEAAEGLQKTPRYLVQVASFSIEKNANELASQLRTDNFSVLMDVVDRPAGRLHRVRVGPYTERSDADAVVSELRSKLTDLTPRVLDLRPTDSAPVSSPSDPLVRWVVQVGSFGNPKSADALVADLRLAGLVAFSEKVSSVDGTVYKVRIGPEIDRDRAAELARKIKAQHPDAFVTTQE